eukprot:2779284-Rhodomonas_salina.4
MPLSRTIIRYRSTGMRRTRLRIPHTPYAMSSTGAPAARRVLRIRYAPSGTDVGMPLSGRGDVGTNRGADGSNPLCCYAGAMPCAVLP